MDAQPMTRRQRRDAERAQETARVWRHGASGKGSEGFLPDAYRAASGEAAAADGNTELLPSLPTVATTTIPPVVMRDNSCADSSVRDDGENQTGGRCASSSELSARMMDVTSVESRSGTRRPLTAAGLTARLVILAVLAGVTVFVPLTARLNVPGIVSASALSPAIAATPVPTAMATSIAASVLGSDADVDDTTDAALSNVPDAATLARIREAYDNARTCTVHPAGASGDSTAFTPVATVVNPMVAGTYTVSSPYGYRIHPTLGTLKLHAGQDYAAPVGTPIYAVAAGKVVTAGMSSDGTGTVTIEHELGGQVWYTSYLHMYEDGIYVSVGDEVSAGQMIAGVGSTGRSTGPHLHFEVRVANDGEDASTVDPAAWLVDHKAAELTSTCM